MTTLWLSGVAAGVGLGALAGFVTGACIGVRRRDLGAVRVLLHWDASHALHFVAEEGATVVCVDEAASERVYTTFGEAGGDAVIDAVIAGADPVDARDRHLPQS
jgi:hypothetical protein